MIELRHRQQTSIIKREVLFKAHLNTKSVYIRLEIIKRALPLMAQGVIHCSFLQPHETTTAMSHCREINAKHEKLIKKKL